MAILETIRVAWGTLYANKLRSFLTMLGVIIGVATVVALVSLGQATQDKIKSKLTSVGTNIINVQTYMGYVRLTMEDMEDVLARVPTVSLMSPEMGSIATVKSGRFKWNTYLIGTSEDYFKITTFGIERGRVYEKREVQARTNVVVLGQTVWKKIGQPPIGGIVMVRGEEFVVIGLLESKGVMMGQDVDDLVFIPYTVQQRMLGTRYIQEFQFKAKSPEVSSVAAGHITRILEDRFRNAERPNDDLMRQKPFTVMSQDELLSVVSVVTGTLAVLLSGIAGVSLLVGGVGIMNIMLVSVTERTREIGIRKAIGARKVDIARQFIIESVTISVIGGAIGLICGSSLAMLIGKIGDMQVVVTAGSVALALGFSSAVGIFFGVYPAMRAANLEPIVALRHE